MSGDRVFDKIKAIKRTRVTDPDSLKILEDGLEHNYAIVRQAATKKLIKHPKGVDVLSRHLEKESVPEIILLISRHLAKRGRIEPVKKKLDELKADKWTSSKLVNRLERLVKRKMR